eukprot:1258197-Rhodomonas_salina.2
MQQWHMYHKKNIQNDFVAKDDEAALGPGASPSCTALQAKAQRVAHKKGAADLVSKNDEAALGAGEGDVDAAPVVEEPHAPVRRRSHR